MSEAWLIELLDVIRDAARRSDMARLAEHLDDAALIAASEIHERRAVLSGDRIGAAL
jgi:hypothetical protein